MPELVRHDLLVGMEDSSAPVPCIQSVSIRETLKKVEKPVGNL